MIKTIDKNFLILLVAFIAASAIRCLLDKNKYINNIVAFINTISLLYVFFIIIENAGKELISLLKNNQAFGNLTKNKKKSHFSRKSNIVQIILLIIGIIYSLFVANPIINDIVGFIALFLSIQTDYIAKSIGLFSYKIK